MVQKNTITLLERLELIWLEKYTKKAEPLEPRIFLEQPELSFGNIDAANMLIKGDNLLALKALEQSFTNSIKCIYIDPPYNTGNASNTMMITFSIHNG